MQSLQMITPELPVARFKLYPYEARWVDDPARLKIACKSRRIGYSFASGLRALCSCLQWKHNVIILSKKEELAKEFISESVAPHVHAVGILASYHQGYIPQTSIHKQECLLSNGSRIIALTANPDSARSYEGDVVLDEFAFHLDARKVYEAVEPSITRGYSLEIISTPNGQQGEYYHLAKAAGLVDGLREPNCEWSAHKTDIYQAIEQGCKDRYENRLNIGSIRAGCLDEEMWLQEYCCQFVSVASQWIPFDLFQRCVSAESSALPGEGIFTTNQVLEMLGRGKKFYVGWDIARSRDLSVLWFSELVSDVTVTRGVICWRNVPTPDQIEMARQLLRSGVIFRMEIDKGVMGLTICEQLAREFPMVVEGVQFTAQNKEAMAVRTKQRMESGKLKVPDDPTVRYSFHSVKRTVNAVGQSRFDAEHDERYGHADHWWSCCLAEAAAEQGARPSLSTCAIAVPGKPIFANLMTEVI
jgi:phage FluMu gp28-like protein